MQLITFLRRLWFALLLHRRVCRWWDRFFPPKSTGEWGERLAERHLLRLGHWILARNYRTRASEIDLITLDHQTVVFVEVKTRTDPRRGQPLAAVNEMKQQRLSRAATSYLHRHGLQGESARFDVIAITINEEQPWPHLQYIRHAFETCWE